MAKGEGNTPIIGESLDWEGPSRKRHLQTACCSPRLVSTLMTGPLDCFEDGDDSTTRAQDHDSLDSPPTVHHSYWSWTALLCSASADSREATKDRLHSCGAFLESQAGRTRRRHQIASFGPSPVTVSSIINERISCPKPRPPLELIAVGSRTEHLLDGGYSDYGFGSTPAFGVTGRTRSFASCSHVGLDAALPGEGDEARGSSHLSRLHQFPARVSLHSSPRRATMHYWTLVERDRAARGLCPAARSIDVRKAWEWGLSCSDWLPRACHFLRGTRSTWILVKLRRFPSLTISFEPREAFWFRYTIPICCSRRRARVMYGLMRSCEWISNKFDAWSWGRFSHSRRFVPQMLCWIGTRPHLRVKRGMLDSCLLPFWPSLLPAPVI